LPPNININHNRYCNRWLPLRANVLEGVRDKKDKQKEVYIDLGNAEGAYKGLHMGVYTVKTVARINSQSILQHIRFHLYPRDAGCLPLVL
jgi:hypothetical protein